MLRVVTLHGLIKWCSVYVHRTVSSSFFYCLVLQRQEAGIPRPEIFNNLKIRDICQQLLWNNNQK